MKPAPPSIWISGVPVIARLGAAIDAHGAVIAGSDEVSAMLRAPPPAMLRHARRRASEEDASAAACLLYDASKELAKHVRKSTIDLGLYEEIKIDAVNPVYPSAVL